MFERVKRHPRNSKRKNGGICAKKSFGKKKTTSSGVPFRVKLGKIKKRKDAQRCSKKKWDKVERGGWNQGG